MMVLQTWQGYIQEHKPYVHCGAHCVNLITQHACTASSVVRDSLQWAHELGVLFGQSMKMKSIFQDIAKAESGPAQSIRPLCPTRWTVRTGAIRSLLNQYQSVLLSLEEMASGKSDSASRANGLLERLQKGNVVLGLLLALEVTEELECLNKSLQSRAQTVDGMLAAVTCVKESIAEKRTPEKFQSLYSKASQMCEKLNLSPIEMPRVRNPPKRLAGEAAAHVPPSSVDYFRTEFFKVLDTVSMQFTERFENEGLLMIRKLEKVLLTGVTDDDVLLQYPEVYRPSLQVQLAMFKSKYDFQSSSEAATILQGMLPEVRGLSEQVEILVWLLLTVPASSAEAERSFSGLQRLKTWLRSTMTQSRLNSVAVCHIHKDKLDQVNRRQIAQQFIAANERRRTTFWCFT